MTKNMYKNIANKTVPSDSEKPVATVAGDQKVSKKLTVKPYVIFVSHSRANVGLALKLVGKLLWQIDQVSLFLLLLYIGQKVVGISLVRLKSAMDMYPTIQT